MSFLNKPAYEASIALLYRASCQEGFLAAPTENDNYRRVWSRDGAICSLAALQSENQQLLPLAKATLSTLFKHQHLLGFMPSNVMPQTQTASYGGAVGRADNASWAIIGLMKYVQQTGDTLLLEEHKLAVEKAFHVMQIWEYNGRGLLYVPMSGDWADEYIQHGYILYDQLLRLWALELAASLYNRNDWQLQASQLRQLLSNSFWVHEHQERYYTSALARQIQAAEPHQWLMGFHPGGIYCSYDLAANALAILLQLGNEQQRSVAITTLIEKITTTHQLLPAYSPAILNNDADMRLLENNYAYTFRNAPHQFHNGGLWPVWNGWAVAALAQNNTHEGALQAAQQLTQRLHTANLQNNKDVFDYGFNEVLHGETGAPHGVMYCTWSAAGAVIAETTLQGKKIYAP